MKLADKDLGLQELVSIVFYCLVGTGVIVHWIHVWLGKPDCRLRDLEARLRSLEEGDRIRDRFALASIGGCSQSVSSSRRGSMTACNTVAGGNNSIFAESVFQTPPLKLLRADSYFSQHGPLSENVSPRDTTPPPLAFPKPPPSKVSQPPSPLCRSPVSPTAAGGTPGQALSSPENMCNSGGTEAAALALNLPGPLSNSTNDIASPRGSHNNNNDNADNADSDVFDTASSAVTSLRACPPPTTAPGAGSRNTSLSRSSFRSHHPHRYGFHYPHLPHLPPVSSGADNRVSHMAGMVGPGPLSD